MRHSRAFAITSASLKDRSLRPVFAVFTLVALGVLAGCGVSNVATPSPGIALQGIAFGGQQPVSGSSISLYAAGLTGNGSGAVNILAPNVVTTNANGNFTILAGSYTCPTPTTQVYLVARGGNPGLAAGTSNPALVMVAALGDCNNFPSTFVNINEVSSVAAAWSLSQFFGAGALAGSSPTNATGLRNAFLTAATLNNLSAGTSPGASLPAGTSVESAKIYSLANALAQCVNSDGTTGCQPLFSAATVSGAAPANTFDAALNIVRNPGANVMAVYNASSANAPFQQALMAVPNDWTLSVTYGNCTPGCGGLNVPGSLALDAAGDVWVANYYGAAVSKFGPTGVPAAANGFPGAGLSQSYGLTLDPSGNAWVTNEPNPAARSGGSVSKFSASGAELSGNGFTGGGVYYPNAVAATPAGLIWVADYSSSAATLLANDGTAISSSNGYGNGALPFTTAVAIDAAQNAWFAYKKGVARVTPGGVVTNYSCCSERLPSLAIDPSGNVWVADYGNFALVELGSNGAVTATISTASLPTAPQAVAIDGAGNVWAANYFGDSVLAVTGSTATRTSPGKGYGLDAPLNEPYSIAVDASGNLWLSNSGNSTLTQFVGLASPIRTPLLGPPSQP